MRVLFWYTQPVVLQLQLWTSSYQMSKKNNQGTRRKQHTFDLAKEAEARKKSEKKSAAAAQKLAVKPQGAKLKKKTKGIRIKKNVVVAGIKIRDAASKRAARKAVKERREAAMEIDN